MLKSVVFQNVKLFNSQNEINLKSYDNGGGLAIIVGENGSGKTMIFECIRRCLPKEKGWNDEEVSKNSKIECQYEFSYDYFLERIDHHDKTGVLQELRHKMKTENPVICSVGVFKHNEENSKVKRYMCLEIDSGDEPLLISRNEDGMVHKKYLENKKSNVSIEQEIEKIEGTESGKISNMLQQCFEVLNLIVEGGLVHFIWPHRGIGPTQDSHSELIKRGRLNFSDTNQRAELFKRLIRDDNIQPTFKQLITNLLPGNVYEFRIEKDREIIPFHEVLKEIIDITQGTQQNVKDEDNSIEVKSSEATAETEYVQKKAGGSQELDKTENKYFEDILNLILQAKSQETVIMEDLEQNELGEVPLLKAPEGIYEAHVFCMILAQKLHYKIPCTICYDEPSRCMHPSLVERMRQLILDVLAQYSHISLILTSHSPCFVTIETWPHIYHTRRNQPQAIDADMSAKKCLVSKCVNDGQDIRKVRFLSRENLRILLFAKKVILVEGERDRIFVSELLHQLPYCSYSYDTVDINKIKSECASTSVVVLDGKQNREKVACLCKYLEIPFIALLDRDVCGNADKEVKFFLEYENNCDCIKKRDRKLLKKLCERLNVFINNLEKLNQGTMRAEKDSLTNLVDKINKIRAIVEDRILKTLKSDEVTFAFNRLLSLSKSNHCFTFSYDEVSKLALAAHNLKKTWPPTPPILKEKPGNILKQQEGNCFFWQTGDLESALNQRDCPDKPVFELEHKNKIIWNFVKTESNNTGDLLNLSPSEVTEVVKNIIGNPQESVWKFILHIFRYLCKLSEADVQRIKP